MTPRYGKGTMASIPYGLFGILPGWLYCQLFTVNVTDLHQIPGTKTAFVWSSSGKQVAVDGYLHAVYRRPRKVIESVKRCDEDLEAELTIPLQELTYDKVGQLLEQVKRSIEDPSDTLVDSEWLFEQATDATRSLSPVEYSCSLRDQTYRTPDEVIQSVYFTPVLRHFRKMPTSVLEPAAGPVKRSIRAAAQTLSDLARIMLTTGRKDDLPREILTYVEAVAALLAKAQPDRSDSNDLRRALLAAEHLCADGGLGEPAMGAIFASVQDTYRARDPMGWYLLPAFAEQWYAAYRVAADELPKQLYAIEQAGIDYLASRRRRY